MTTLPTTYPHPIPIAVIGGTGFYDLPSFRTAAHLTPTTPWGSPSSPLIILEHTTPTGTVLPVAFLSRHGLNHEHTPSSIPNRANIAALRSVGVRCIVSFSAAGSLREEIRPRDFVVPDQVIDRTWGREGTFFEEGLVCHVPMADPYDEGVRKVILSCAEGLKEGAEGVDGQGIKMHDRGTVVVIQGPAFSTRAESHMYRSWGGDVINMSTFPEAKLAREAEIGYGQIVMSTDYDCWKGEEDVSVEMVMGHMKANLGNAKRLVAKVLDELGKDEYADLRAGKAWEGQRRFGVSTKPEGMKKEVREKLEWLFPGYFGEAAGRPA
jgi:5'-methylthioadenosine phosphorylase